MSKTSRHLLISISAIYFAAAPLCLAQKEDASATEAKAAPALAHQKDKTLLDSFLAGGPLMWPILLCSIGTLAVASYCFLNIQGKKMMPQGQVESVGTSMRQLDPSSAYQVCNSQPNVFANTMCAALLKVNFEKENANKISMEQAAGETLTNEETKLTQWVNYLNVFATIAPMLGLLGTVTGMIESFDTLAAGKSEPSDLADGIGVAMITTAGGLIVGIPAMFCYFYFKNLLTIQIANIQKRVTFMLDVLSGELKLEGGVNDYQQTQQQQSSQTTTQQ